MKYQTKRKIADAVQFTDPDNLPEGVYVPSHLPNEYCLSGWGFIWLTDWIIDGKEVMTDEKFREMYEEVPDVFRDIYQEEIENDEPIK